MWMIVTSHIKTNVCLAVCYTKSSEQAGTQLGEIAGHEPGNNWLMLMPSG